MKSVRLLFLAMISIGSAQADPPFTESVQLVLQAVAQGKTIPGLARVGLTTTQALAVPYRLQGDDCISIGLVRIGSASIENWRLCGGSLERLPGISPRLSPVAAPRMEELARWAAQEAASHGQKLTGWEDYEILARRLSETDANDCPKVETIILIDGLLVSRQVSGVCPK